MKLLICAGGTGGGVYPALSVAQAFNVERSTLNVTWVGGVGGMEADLVKREGIPFEAIPAAGLHGVGARALPGNLLSLARGLAASRRILRERRPDVLLFTGGFVAAPMALAARLPGLGFPRPRSLVYVPDLEPGLALKALIRLSDAIAITAEQSRRYLPRRGRAIVTGYPLRQGLQPMPADEARRALGLDENLPTLLVTGGSKGARTINRALLANLPALLTDMQVIHLCGKLDWAEVEAARARLTPEQAARYRAFDYLHEMNAALSAADVVLSRAGASSLGEYPLFGLPAILVPYPHAWRYQRVNADYLVGQGAALVVEDSGLKDSLLPLVGDLMADAARREKMGQAMRSLAHPQAAEHIASLLQALAEGSAHA